MSYIGSTPANKLVTSSDMEDGIVTTSKIADDAATADKIANAVNSAISANTSKTTNATHSGEVTGSGALTIADNIVDEANLKVSNSPTNGYFLAAQSGNTGGLTWTAAPSSYADSDALSLFNASGSAGVYACRAWVNFNGTGTVAIRSSGNVSSITDQATGQYRINFGTAMQDVNYSVAQSHGRNDTTAIHGFMTHGDFATGSFDLETANTATSAADFKQITLAVFR